MTLIGLLDLYDNWNGNLVVNDKNCDLYARVQFDKMGNWLWEHKTIACKEVMAFGFYDGELSVRVNI